MMGSGASAYALKTSIDRLLEIERVLNDVKHIQHGADVIRDNLLRIQEKCRDHYRSLKRDAGVVIENCKA